MSLEKRIRALEARMIAAPVILYFADGSTQAISGRMDFLLNLLQGVGDEANLSSHQVAQLDLIYKSVAAHEPGGGRMIELIRSIQEPPEERGRTSAPMPEDLER